MVQIISCVNQTMNQRLKKSEYLRNTAEPNRRCGITSLSQQNKHYSGIFTSSCSYLRKGGLSSAVCAVGSNDSCKRLLCVNTSGIFEKCFKSWIWDS